MKSIRSLFIRGLGAAVTLAVVAFCSLNAQAEVVFGELGATVAAPIDAPAIDSGSQDSANVNWLVHGVDAGLPGQPAAGAVTVGVADADIGTIPLSAAIFASQDAATSPTLDASGAQNIEAIEKFMNQHATVDPDAGYTLVLSSGSWQISAGLRLTPDDRGDFGRRSARAAASPATTTIPKGPWSNATAEDSWTAADEEALSMEAVPEPSSAIVAGFGILGVAVMHRRRRRS